MLILSGNLPNILKIIVFTKLGAETSKPRARKNIRIIKIYGKARLFTSL
jgi:hypothetical protein